PPDEPGGNRHHEIEKIPYDGENPALRRERRLDERRVPAADAGGRNSTARRSGDEHNGKKGKQIDEGGEGTRAAGLGISGGFSGHGYPLRRGPSAGADEQ